MCWRAVVVVLRSPAEQDGCCCVDWVGQMTTSGGPEHEQEVGRPPGLGRTSGHREPPRGRAVDGNLSPSMSLHRLPHCTGSKGAPGIVALGCVCACVCVCPAPLTLRQPRRRTQWTACLPKPVTQSAAVRDAAAFVPL